MILKSLLQQFKADITNHKLFYSISAFLIAFCLALPTAGNYIFNTIDASSVYTDTQAEEIFSQHISQDQLSAHNKIALQDHSQKANC